MTALADMPSTFPAAIPASGDWLPMVFMAIMGLAMLAYVLLDGYDLGVGMWMARADAAGRHRASREGARPAGDQAEERRRGHEWPDGWPREHCSHRADGRPLDRAHLARPPAEVTDFRHCP